MILIRVSVNFLNCESEGAIKTSYLLIRGHESDKK